MQAKVMKNTNNSSTIRLLASIAFLSAVDRLAADYPSTVTALGPVGYYRLGETTPVRANKAINSGSAGALGDAYYLGDDDTYSIQGAPGLITGTSNTGATFDQTTEQVIQVPFNSALVTRVFSAEGWFSPNNDPAGLTAAMAFGHLANAAGSGRSGWLLYQDNGASSGGKGWNLRFYNNVGINRALTLTGGDVPTAGSINHVAITFDGTKASLYVNGVLSASGPATDYVPSVDGNFSIGRRDDFAFEYHGSIDEVAVYTNVLSAADVAAHYANGTSASPAVPYDTLVKQSNPLLYYRLDEPAFVPPTTLPTTANAGSWGSGGDGSIDVGVTTGQGGVPYAGFGPNNKAPDLNGLQGSISIPPQNLATDTMTITAWVKRHGPTEPGSSQGSGQGGWAGIVYQRGTTADGAKATGLQFGPAGTGGNGILRYNWNDVANTYNFNSGLNLPNDVWSFVAGVFTPTQTVLCVNGVLVTNIFPNDPHDFSTDPILIGKDPTGRRIPYAGIDEVAIFDKALTAAQLQQLYAAGTPPPAITAQPKGPAGTLYEGFDISLSVTAVGGQPLSYKWLRGTTPVSGQTASTLALKNVKASDSGDYVAVVSNTFGSATSSVVSLTILAGPPILTSAPAPVSILPGGTAKFTSTAVGSSPISFQWFLGETALPGETGPTLTIPQVQAADAGNYKVVATNPNGNTPSAVAALTILPTSPNYVSAVLTRSPVAYWRLNETSGSIAYDSVGSLNGTYKPATTKNNSPGAKPTAFQGLEADNTAYLFDGNTSDITAPALNINNDAMTIILLLQPKGLPPTDLAGLVFTRGGGSGTSGLNTKTGGNLGYHWNDAGETFNWDSALLPVNDQWNFVALVVEPSKATMYMDSGSGMQTAVNEVSHGISTWSGPTHMGTDPSGNRIYGGLMDEVAVFNRALSPADIQAIRDAAYLGTFTPVAAKVVLDPVTQTGFVGDNITLRAAASGTQPLTYQWTKNNQPIPGAIRGSLTIPSATEADSGTYRWTVTQGNSTVNSAQAVLTVLPIPAYANLTDGLVLHLKFDGDYADSSARGNNGTGANKPGFVPDGQFGQALHVAGGKYLSVPDPKADLAFDVADSFSVSVWLRYTTRFNDLPIIGNAVNSTYLPGWVISEDQGKFEWTLVSDMAGSVIADPVGGPLIDNGAWHNMVVVFDRAAEKASSYIDGQFINTRGIVGLGTLVRPDDLTIGQDPTGAYGTGTFDLDDVGIWRKSLSAVEARSVYFAGQSGHSFDAVKPAGPSPVLTPIAGLPGAQFSNVVVNNATKTITADLPAGATTAGYFSIVPPVSITSVQLVNGKLVITYQ